MKGLIVGGILLLVVAVIIVPIIAWAIGVNNTEIGLRNQFDAAEKVIVLTHDTMWKTISQKYQISDAYKKAFIEAISEVVEGRKGGSLLKFTTEANPAISENLYKEIMATVEGKRDLLQSKQQIVLDISVVHKNLCQKFPTSLILSGRPALEVKLITSARSEDALETGRDNDVNLR
jgi:hypothetical protein